MTKSQHDLIDNQSEETVRKQQFHVFVGQPSICICCGERKPIVTMGHVCRDCFLMEDE